MLIRIWNCIEFHLQPNEIPQSSPHYGTVWFLYLFILIQYTSVKETLKKKNTDKIWGHNVQVPNWPFKKYEIQSKLESIEDLIIRCSTEWGLSLSTNMSWNAISIDIFVLSIFGHLMIEYGVNNDKSNT